MLLPGRKVMRIRGADASKFLQGAMTNDIHSLGDGGWMYCVFLDHSGRVMFDAFIARAQDSFILDYDSGYDVIDYFQRSKFRSKVYFEDEVGVVAFSYTDGWPDPRCDGLGNRVLLDYDQAASDQGVMDEYAYNRLRISLCVPDVRLDMVRGVSMPLDFRIDLVNGISFNKGCYCGQEALSKGHNIVGRMRDIRVIRSDGTDIPSKGTSIICDGLVVGKTCYSVGNIGLGVFNLSKLGAEGQGYEADGVGLILG